MTFVGLSCAEDFDKQAYIQRKLDKKCQQFINKEFVKCKVKAEERATQYVDSLISQWINEEMLDTAAFPDKPVKPNRPEDIIDQWEDPKEKKQEE